MSQPGEWSAYRGDQRRTARATLPCDIRQPRTLWRWPVGGVIGTTRVADVDGDGRAEIVATFAGGVTAFRNTGQRLWSRTFPRGGWLFAVADVDGDGRVEVLAGSANPSQLIVLDGRDGAVLSAWTFDDFVGFGGKLCDVDGDGRPELIMFANKAYRNRGENGAALTFSAGAERPARLWGGQPTAQWFNLHCRPYPVIGDVDGDGRPEVVFITKWPGASKYAERMIVACLDAATGEVKETCDYDGHRPYGALQIADLDGSGRMSVLNAGWGHLATFGWTDRGLNLAYNRMVVDGRTLQDIAGPYGPRGELMMLIEGQGGAQYGFDHARMIFDLPPLAPAFPYVLLIDPRQSRTVWHRAGHSLAGAADVDGDGSREIYTLEGDALCAHKAGAETGRLERARLLFYQADEPEAVSNNYFPAKSGAQAVHLDADGDGADELLAVWRETPDAPGQLAWLDGLTLQPRRAVPLDDPATQAVCVADAFGLGRPQVLLVDSLGRLTVLDPRGERAASMATGGWQPQPSVAAFRAGGPPRVLVADAARRVQCLDATDGQPRLAWQTGGMLGAGSVPIANLPVSIVDDGPLIESLSAGDGERYLFHVGRDRRLRLIDGDGNEARSYDPGPSAGDRLRVAVGHFLDPARKDIYLSLDYPSAPTQADHLARSDTGGTAWANPMGVCWYPAVADARGTGRDDLIGVWYFTYHHIDGATGRSLFVDGGRPGYHHLAVLDVNGDGRLEALASGGYMSIYCADAATGALAWKIDGLDYNAGRAAGVADVDGDGALELGIAFLDGRFNCYDGATGALKWSLDLGAAGSDCIAADVDGDGRMEFVLGSHDEHLWAIGVRDGRPRVVWRHRLSGAVGSPVAADIDGDGRCEILVAAGDGYVYAIGR
jgi:outer membrane protein assembly factor BamB